MDYYKRYMGDYGRDTSRLSMMEHGAYSLLLDDYYSTRAPLPADMDALYRVCRAMSKQEQAAVASVAKRFFPLGEDGLRHSKRADEEIAKWEEMAEENRQKGKLGGRPKKNPDGNPSGNPQGNPAGSYDGKPEETQRVPISKPGENPLQIQNPNPEARSLNHSHVQDARARALRNGSVSADLEGKGLSDAESHARFESLRADYPECAGNEDWITAEHHARLLVERGEATWDFLHDRVRRFAAWAKAGGVSGRQYVMGPITYFTRKDRPWSKSHDPPSTKADQRLDNNIAAAAEAKRRLFGDAK